MVVGISLPVGAQAQSSAAEFAQAFISHCAQNLPHLERIEAAANAFGYQEIGPEMLQAVGPLAPNSESKGWVVLEGPGAPYLLGTSVGRLDGNTFAVCSVASPDLNAEDVVANLTQFLQLAAPEDDSREAGQRYRVWTILAPGGELVLSVTDAEPMSMPGVTVGAMIPVS
jgi:hypothetical protein